MNPFAFAVRARPRPASPRGDTLATRPVRGVSVSTAFRPAAERRASAKALFGCITKCKNCFRCLSDTTFFCAGQARFQNSGMNIGGRGELRILIKETARRTVRTDTDARGSAGLSGAPCLLQRALSPVFQHEGGGNLLEIFLTGILSGRRSSKPRRKRSRPPSRRGLTRNPLTSPSGTRSLVNEASESDLVNLTVLKILGDEP